MAFVVLGDIPSKSSAFYSVVEPHPVAESSLPRFILIILTRASLMMAPSEAVAVPTEADALALVLELPVRAHAQRSSSLPPSTEHVEIAPGWSKRDVKWSASFCIRVRIRLL